MTDKTRKDFRAGKPLSESRKKELQEQRRAALGGLSPNQFSALRDIKILEWVWKWGYSSKSVIQKLSQTSRHGVCDRMVKRGLLRETRTASGLGFRSYFTLTEAGLSEIERKADVLHKYDFLDPYRVRQNILRHDLMAQDFTVENLIKKNIVGFETMFTNRVQSRVGVKQPDAIWLMPDGQRFGIEIELTKKWDRDFDDFRLKVLRALESGQFDKFYLVTDSRAIKKAYEQGMSFGSRINTWSKNRFGKYIVTGSIEIPDWMGSISAGKFLCCLIE